MSELTIARTALGDLKGLAADGIVQFRGVPYAAAPVGGLRFTTPRPAAAWMGVRDATRHGPIAPQFPARLKGVMGDFERPQDEDCLSLTISTPAADGKARPVLVWLHGGGYMSGAGSLDWYDGSGLARGGDMVVVGVNYRQGALGYLHLPGVTEGVPGLLDVVLALEWVRDHISAFGGDPGRVTMAGQSGGAHVIMCLLTMPTARGLFRRAILQSPPAGMAPLSSAAAAGYAGKFLELLEPAGDTGATPAARLRAATPAAILTAQHKLIRATARFAEIAPPFVPAIDALADPGAFIAAAAAGAGAAGIDLVMGTTRDEATAFFCDPLIPMPPVPPDQVAARFAAIAGRDGAIDLYRRRHPGATPGELLSDVVTDHMLAFPTLRFAAAASEAGARVWAYQFDWAPPGSRFGACHCIELPFVFGNPAAWTAAPMLAGADPAVFEAMSAAVRAAWTTFVQGGDPAPGVPWPRYEAAKRQTLCFGPVIGAMGDPAGIEWRGRRAA